MTGASKTGFAFTTVNIHSDIFLRVEIRRGLKIRSAEAGLTDCCAQGLQSPKTFRAIMQQRPEPRLGDLTSDLRPTNPGFNPHWDLPETVELNSTERPEKHAALLPPGAAADMEL